MMTCVRHAPGLAACLGLVLLAGCTSTGGFLQQAGKTPSPPRPLKATEAAGAEEAAPVSLTTKQVADVQIAMARSMEAEADKGKAVEAYREALKRDPTRADACGRLAVLLDCQGKPEEAAEWHQRALALEPDNPDLLCNQGYSLYLQGKTDAAAEALRRAVRQRPDHARARANLGLVLARQGRDEEALQEFRRAGVSPAEAQANLAYGCALRGAWADARSHYQAALSADPSSAAARKGLARLDAVLVRRSASDPALAQDPAVAALLRERSSASPTPADALEAAAPRGP